MHVDPLRILFVKHHARRTGSGIREQQVQIVLHAIQALDENLPARWRPHHARQQILARLAQIHPSRRAAGSGNNSEPHVGIRIAGLRIALRLQHSPRVQ